MNAFQRSCSNREHTNMPITISLHSIMFQVNVLYIQGHQLRNAQPCSIEQLQHCQVTLAPRSILVYLLEDALHFAHTEHVRQILLDTRRLETCHRIIDNHASPAEIVKKRFEGGKLTSNCRRPVDLFFLHPRKKRGNVFTCHLMPLLDPERSQVTTELVKVITVSENRVSITV